MFRILFMKIHCLKYLLLYMFRKGKSPEKQSTCYTEKIRSYGNYIKPHKGTECKLEPHYMYSLHTDIILKCFPLFILHI